MKLLIVDDHPIVREGPGAMLRQVDSNSFILSSPCPSPSKHYIKPLWDALNRTASI
jgi:DNA-binding NarL/FixJ family response regulator